MTTNTEVVDGPLRSIPYRVTVFLRKGCLVINDQPNSLILAIDEATLRPLGILQLEIAETHPKLSPYTRNGHQSTHTKTTSKEKIFFSAKCCAGLSTSLWTLG